jgi:hypothetical protein
VRRNAMTTTPSSGPTDPHGGDRVLPPYDDRRQSADVDTDDEKLHRDGANVGAATGPVETDDSMKSTPKEDTPRGAEASPANETPAAETPEDTPHDPGVGPAHYAGTQRGEDERKGRDQSEGRD